MTPAIVAIVLVALLLGALLLAWRYDRRHGRRRVSDRSADMEVRLAETSFQSQNPQGRAGNSVL